MNPLTRRGFVVASCSAAAASASASAATAEFLFFTPSQAALVTILTEQIIPSDSDPGAMNVGVVYYIDRQLTGPLAEFAPLYRTSLTAFEPIREMSFAAQTEFLKSIEAKEHGEPAARLFAVLIDHTMQGFYGAPSHGGNRGEASWKMLGIDKEMSGGHH
jgi:gluconate 2-dehydrogenase gamma chain